MKLSIKHTTDYAYSEVLRYAVQELRLSPQDSDQQTIESWKIKGFGPLIESADAWGNVMNSCTLSHPTAHSVVIAEGVVQTHGNPLIQDKENQVSPLIYLRGTDLTEPHPRLTEFAKDHLLAAREPEEVALALASAVSERVNYRSGQTAVDTTALEAFDWGWGVCQDQAHVMLAVCRSSGLPARYVSGYFYAVDAPELASHAWVDVCIDIEKNRWVSVDVTHACLMDERHVRLAVGPDYAGCAPIKGVRQGGGKEKMVVKVEISVV